MRKKGAPRSERDVVAGSADPGLEAHQRRLPSQPANWLADRRGRLSARSIRYGLYARPEANDIHVRGQRTPAKRVSTPTEAIMGRLFRLTLTVFALSTLLSPALAAEGSATRGQRVFASPTWPGMAGVRGLELRYPGASHVFEMSVITVVSSAETRQPRLFAFELRRIKNPADPIAFMMTSLLRHPVMGVSDLGPSLILRL